MSASFTQTTEGLPSPRATRLGPLAICLLCGTCGAWVGATVGWQGRAVPAGWVAPGLPGLLVGGLLGFILGMAPPTTVLVVSRTPWGLAVVYGGGLVWLAYRSWTTAGATGLCFFLAGPIAGAILYVRRKRRESRALGEPPA
ncbi:hypothetical protein [Paludisphaera mucosa]|uniref:Integral membrane protein n=1 Tax=Paludisphaera mucosa TaxID=3030827 RepID=A0ABT6FC79_9BACT|nr:hypothetical protein [Paludisphaera mucosa]MDG3005191.1 hypothetical protein [Paludisphaera mucosa]